MSHWIFIDILVCLVVMVLAGLIIPQILLIAFRKKLFDDTDPRKIHKGAVPRLGGIAFFPAILFSLMLMLGISRQSAPELLTEILPATMAAFSFIICAVIVLYLVGIADDLIGVKYRAKFVSQIFAAVLVVVGGIHLNNLHGFLGINHMPVILSVVLTILLMVFIINAINLIDGIDGLASGLSTIAAAFYGLVLFKARLYLYSMMAFATFGALLPFFYYNVFGDANKHRKIFMGDTGALTIGLILSTLSIRICSIDDTAGHINMGVVAFSPLLIPCFDVVRVYIHRLKEHHNPFLPDKTHIHHKLLALGMSQRLAMPVIVAASLVVTLLNYWLCVYINITILFGLDLLLWIVANHCLTRAIRRREKKLGEKLY